jgi:Response regulator containing a CheY-like receiver domain and an HTH DNA-binding domain
MEKLKILIADDHALLRDGLKALVNSEPDMEVVGEAENGNVVLEKIKQLKPDVVVMDISMPELNGARATRRLKSLFPTIKVLALTAHEDNSYLRHMLEAGASGFLLKRAAADQLIKAIHVVANDACYIDPTFAGKVLSRFMRPVSRATTERNELSERETEVLTLTAWGHSNKEIASRLDISVKTVETYKARLLEKLQLTSRTEIVRYAVRHGWLQES